MFFKDRLTRWLLLGGFILLVVLGLVLDNLPSLNNDLLFISFHISGMIGLFLAAYIIIKKIDNLWLRAAFCVLVLMVWRISYFPVMVIGGYFAALGESVTNYISLTQLYPIFLISIALLNYIAVIIAGGVFLMMFYKISHQHNNKLISHSVLTSISLPLVILAIAVSFSHPSDWHALPDTSYIDRKPLPAPSLPEINPYWTALDGDNLLWQQRILFSAAAITYDMVPENTRWSHVVKGTLEKEFITTKQITTAFCTKIHYRAFITAHPFLKDKEKFNTLSNQY